MPEIGKYDLYRYIPSIAAAAVAVVLFSIFTVLHMYRMIGTRLWICVPFTLGGIFEVVGYIGRAVGHSHPESLGAYIIQSIFVLVAPALFAATIYMTLGRLMRVTHAESYSVVRVTWLTKLFVCGDVFTFFVQGGGGGIMGTSDPDKVKLGQNVILGGLFLQILLFGLFILVSIIFHFRLRKQPTPESCAPTLKWQKMLLVLYAVSAVIMTRNIFRVVEYLGGRDGPLLRVEWPNYVFDALLMAATMAIWLVGYPTLIRPGKSLASDTESGMQMPEHIGRTGVAIK